MKPYQMPASEHGRHRVMFRLLAQCGFGVVNTKTSHCGIVINDVYTECDIAVNYTPLSDYIAIGKGNPFAIVADLSRRFMEREARYGR